MNIDDITRIAELMTAHDLAELVIESPEIKLSLKRSAGAGESPAPVVAVPAVIPAPVAPVVGPAPGLADPAAAPAKRPEKVLSIDSPIVGTFYSASSPDAPPFVKIGDKVTEESVVCIVEAMKVMNEVKAEKRGVIRRALVENGKPVEYGQPLFEIEED